LEHRAIAEALVKRFRPRRDRTRLPRIEAAARYRQHVAHRDHRPRRRLLVDERELHAFAFAKNAAAFFNISRSISRRFTRLRNSLSSSRSAVVSTLSGRLPASASARFTHSRRAVSVRSRSAATCATERPPAAQSFTASALNSSVNFLR